MAERCLSTPSYYVVASGTTPIYYVNADPHLGVTASTASTMLADVQA